MSTVSELLPAVTVAKEDIDREVYLAIAEASDAETDVVAGILTHLALARPNLSAAQLREATQTVADAIAEHTPDRATDPSPSEAFRMSRILTAVVPRLAGQRLREAATAYTRAFFRSFRQGVTQRRQVQPLDLQFDRLAQVQEFRRGIWRQLRQAAAERAPVATAIDSGPLGAALGVATTDGAAEAVAKVELPTLRRLISDHIEPDGRLG